MTNRKTKFIHSGAAKKTLVRRMFDRIAGHYDFLNHLLSLGHDIYWRRKLTSALAPQEGEWLLDVATGTGDQALAALKRAAVKVVGVDFAREMLQIAAQKKTRRNIGDTLQLIQGDAENLPFPNETFHALTISFGIRNVGFMDRALSEFFRVLRPGGRLLILEFSRPTGWFFPRLYNFYFNHFLPWLAGLFSRKEDYEYLPESVRHFPERDDFLHLLELQGFENARCLDLTRGIVSLYQAEKPD